MMRNVSACLGCYVQGVFSTLNKYNKKRRPVNVTAVAFISRQARKATACKCPTNNQAPFFQLLLSDTREGKKFPFILFSFAASAKEKDDLKFGRQKNLFSAFLCRVLLRMWLRQLPRFTRKKRISFWQKFLNCWPFSKRPKDESILVTANNET